MRLEKQMQHTNDMTIWIITPNNSKEQPGISINNGEYRLAQM